MDQEADALERAQELEVLQSMYLDDLKMLSSDELSHFEIVRKGFIERDPFDQEKLSDAAVGHISISEVPFKISHVGVMLRIKYVQDYPSSQSPEIELIPLFDLNRLLNVLNNNSQTHAQVRLKLEMQMNEIKSLKQIMDDTAASLSGMVVVFSLIQNLDDYMVSNNVSAEDAENEYLKMQDNRKIVKNSVILKVTSDDKVTSVENKINIRQVTSYTTPEEEPIAEIKPRQPREMVSVENLKFLENAGRVSVETISNTSQLFTKKYSLDEYWLNRYLHTSVNAEASIFYAFGGIHLDKFSNDLIRFGHEMGNMFCKKVQCATNVAPCPKVFHSMAFHDGTRSAYVFGGMDEQGNYLNEAHLFWHNQWLKTTPLPKPMGLQTVSVYQDKLVCFGGYNGTEYSNNLICGKISYMTSQIEFWSTLNYPNAPSPRAGCSSCVVDNIFFVFGGRDETRFYNDMYLFDMDMKYWTTVVVNGIPAPALAFASNFLKLENDKYAICGGYSGSTWNTYLHQFNMETKRWNILLIPEVMEENRLAFCSVAEFGYRGFIFSGGYFNKISINSLFKAHLKLKQKTQTKQTNTMRVYQEQVKYSSESRSILKDYCEWFLLQNEDDSDLIFNVYSKDENGYTQKDIICCHKFVVQFNSILKRFISVQEVKDGTYGIIEGEQGEVSEKGTKMYIDIQQYPSYENVRYKILFACLQFIYSQSFNSDLIETEEDALELYDLAMKLKLKELCHLICMELVFEKTGLPQELISIVPQFLTMKPVPKDEEDFLNTRDEFEVYQGNSLEEVKTGLVRLVAPDLYSKLAVERARFWQYVKEQDDSSSQDPQTELEDIPTFSEEEELLMEGLDNMEMIEHQWNKQSSQEVTMEWKSLIVHKGLLIARSGK